MSDGTRACQRKAHGLDNVRTMKSQGARSLPKSHSEVYIDLFVLHKEKERLQKELAETEKRAEKTTKRLSEIGARICKMEAAYREGGVEANVQGVSREAPKKDWKVMNIRY